MRFTSAVPAGARVRLHAVIDAVEAVPGGLQLATLNEIELEGQERPAVIARLLVRVVPTGR